MKKLMMLCLGILILILSALSGFNFSFSVLDRIEKDKSDIVIEKPQDVSMETFLKGIAGTVQALDADIMLRRENNEGKSLYLYYVTSNASDFLDVHATGNFSLSKNECIATTDQSGYVTKPLNEPSLFFDIAFFDWSSAYDLDLSTISCSVKENRQAEIVYAIANNLGYAVTAGTATTISGQFSIVLFSFIPALMLIASMLFYTLSGGKKNVLKKMDGYSNGNILVDEIKSVAPSLVAVAALVGCAALLVALLLYRKAFVYFLLFSLSKVLLLVAVLFLGCVLSYLAILRQKSAEHIKGKVPKQGIYVLTILAKCAFVTFMIFFLSIGIRNVTIAYNTVSTFNHLSEKVDGYVTIPVSSNTFDQNLMNGYQAFYDATVNRYEGILINTSNYAYDLINGKTLAEEFGQETISINRNYLDFNPIYDINGATISEQALSLTTFNVLIPQSKLGQKEQYRESVSTAYGMEANFIPYDNKESKIYSYNAETGTGAYGEIDSPVIYVVENQQLDGAFIMSFCSKGEYMLKIPFADSYSELLPILRETGIESVTPYTSTVASTFNQAVANQRNMLILYGSQSIALIIGLLFLILFSAKLYCENYKKKIACLLIDGYLLLACIKKHLIITAIYYATVFLILSFYSITTGISLNYAILMVAFALEIVITVFISRKYTQQNLYQIVKGAD